MGCQDRRSKMLVDRLVFLNSAEFGKQACVSALFNTIVRECALSRQPKAAHIHIRTYVHMSQPHAIRHPPHRVCKGTIIWDAIADLLVLVPRHHSFSQLLGAQHSFQNHTYAPFS